MRPIHMVLTAAVIAVICLPCFGQDIQFENVGEQLAGIIDPAPHPYLPTGPLASVEEMSQADYFVLPTAQAVTAVCELLKTAEGRQTFRDLAATYEHLPTRHLSEHFFRKFRTRLLLCVMTHGEDHDLVTSLLIAAYNPGDIAGREIRELQRHPAIPILQGLSRTHNQQGFAVVTKPQWENDPNEMTRRRLIVERLNRVDEKYGLRTPERSSVATTSAADIESAIPLPDPY